MAKTSQKGKKRIPWSANDEDRLIENIRKNSLNLSKAFKVTSQEIQRTPTAVSAHWYANTSVRSGHVFFMTVSGNEVLINRTRMSHKKKKSPLLSQKSNVSLFKKILNMFKLTY